MKSSNDTFKKDAVEWKKTMEDEEMEGSYGHYNETYRAFAELLGEKAVIKIWQNYSGLTITFPQKLYSRDYTRQYIREHMDEMNVREIAKQIQLSERRVRQIIHELREENEK